MTEPQLSALTVRVEATHLGRIAAALVSGYHQRPGKDAAGAPARSDAPKTNVAHLVGVALAPAAVAPAGASLGGLRHDSGKVRLDLIPPEWIEALGQVLTKGAEKYAARNWEKGMAWSKMIGCAMRHLLAFLRGERFDQETGCHHLAHAAWNVLALMSYDVRGIGDHDLPRAKTSPTMLVGDGEARP